MNNSLKDKLSAFERLLNIMDDLRKDCPWDKEQTYDSLRHLTIEETYELSEAIYDKDVENIKNEDTTWYGSEQIEVVLKVDSSVAEYSKRRKILDDKIGFKKTPFRRTQNND